MVLASALGPAAAFPGSALIPEHVLGTTGPLGSLTPFNFVDSSSGLTSMKWEGGPTEVELVDWDLDGNPDILSVGDHGNPRINSAEDGFMRYLGDGQGGWSLKQGGGFGYGGLGIGDLNQDGVNDLVVGTHHNYPNAGCGNKLVDVCLGPNLQTWNTGMSTAGETYGMFSSEVGDFDDDGWLDVASNTFGSPSGGAGTVVYRNNRDGSWTNTFKTPTGVSTHDIAVGDFDADGRLDLVSPNDGGSVFRGDGTGKMNRSESGLPVFYNGDGMRGFSLGDVDNDGMLELALTKMIYISNGTAISLPELYRWEGSSWRNVSAGIWSQFDLSKPNSWTHTQMGDLDLDGNVDLAVAGRTGFTVLRGDGAGGFTREYDHDWNGTNARYWTAFRLGADGDHNGYPDLAGVISFDDGGFQDHSEPHFFKNLANGSASGSVVFPRGGERFYPGSMRFIDWTLAGTAPAKIEISTSGSAGPWTLVKDGLPNNGRHQWTVPATPSKNCYIRVSSGSSAVASARPFEIVGSSGPAPLVAQVTAPNGGETLTAGQSYDIKFTIGGGTMPARGTLELSTSGPSGPWAKVADLAGLGGGAGKQSWTVPAAPTTTGFMRITTTDSSPAPQTAGDASDAGFTIVVPQNVVLERVEVAPASVKVTVGRTQSFAATALDTQGKAIAGATFSWVLSGAVGTLSPNGDKADLAATTPGTGTLEVTATYGPGSKTATASVEVVAASPPPLAKVTLTPTSASGNLGDRLKFAAKAFDSAGKEMAGVAFTWKVTGGIGALDSTEGPEVTLALAEAGSGTVEVSGAKDGRDATAKATVASKRPFVFPWDLLFLVIGAIAAVVVSALLAGWWRRKKRDEERERRAWEQWRREQAAAQEEARLQAQPTYAVGPMEAWQCTYVE
jgi:hypothetical protein